MTTMRLANFQKAVNNTTTHYPIYIYIYIHVRKCLDWKKGCNILDFST